MFFLPKPRGASPQTTRGFSPNHEGASPQTTRGLLPKPRGGFSPNREGASPQTTKGRPPNPRGASPQTTRGFSPNHEMLGGIHLELSKGRVDGTGTSVRACPHAACKEKVDAVQP